MNRRRSVILLLSLVLLVLVSCEYERMYYQDSIRPFEQQMPDPPEGIVPAAPPTLQDAEYPLPGGEKEYDLAEIGSLESPFPSTPESIARGLVAYRYYCVQCHGTRYNGDGTVGQSFFPLPTDLRSARVQQELDDDAMFRSISYGAGVDEQTGAVRHPPLFATVTIEDRWHLIHWIRSLGPRDPNEQIPSGSYDQLTEFMK